MLRYAAQLIFRYVRRTDEDGCPFQEQFCDFEDDLCLWNQDSDRSFDWVRRHGRTPSNFTGPALDHTLIDINSKI